MRRLFSLSIPTIALVQNACFGGGIGYVAGCDIAIASEDARFAISEVRIGITSVLNIVVSYQRHWCASGPALYADSGDI
jgi:methylglutaconyl-CoA hydratase